MLIRLTLITLGRAVLIAVRGCLVVFKLLMVTKYCNRGAIQRSAVFTRLLRDSDIICRLFFVQCLMLGNMSNAIQAL